MAGTYVKKAGTWRLALVGGSGFGSIVYTKKAGVWVNAFGGAGTGTSVYVKRAGVWVTESFPTL